MSRTVTFPANCVITSDLIAARERECGVRLALGSAPGAIAGLVFRRGPGGWQLASPVMSSAS
jgi:hypothetical protein